jgi:hypothetical protein
MEHKLSSGSEVDLHVYDPKLRLEIDPPKKLLVVFICPPGPWIPVARCEYPFGDEFGIATCC